jgi:hypothetical protein
MNIFVRVHVEIKTKELDLSSRTKARENNKEDVQRI